MNTNENKQLLWQLLLDSNGFKEGVSIEKTQLLFETIIGEVDQLPISLTEKNKKCLEEFIQRIQKQDTDLVKYREELFEERVKQNQEKYKARSPPMKDLTEIKQLLYLILDKIDNL
jgi:hypothetical protein